jgi:hypothetical protein
MDKKAIPLVLMLFLLIAAPAVKSEIVWPGEKKFAGYTTLDQLKPVFDRDTSAYDRRYLIQALPFFAEKNKITYSAPNWLVSEIAKGVVSNDQELVLESILAVKQLKIYSLTDTLIGVYRKARRIWAGSMPRIHMPIIACLSSFNNPRSRIALASIASTPLPAKIAQDIVPALKGIGQIGDSSCASALTALSTRLRSLKDSISILYAKAKPTAADSTMIDKLTKIRVLADKISTMAQARGSAK